MPSAIQGSQRLPPASRSAVRSFAELERAGDFTRVWDRKSGYGVLRGFVIMVRFGSLTEGQMTGRAASPFNEVLPLKRASGE
jgi:hypothetical protein